ncbi:MAG: hypothetical protein ACT4P7_12250 [Gemmatimonadaceae bacterium]
MTPTNRRCVVAFVLLSGCLTKIGSAQGGETVLIEQRILLQDRLTPRDAKRRALEEAMAEAVRRVAGVRVRSSAVSTTSEDRDSTRSTYRSIVQLDAAGRAVDARVLDEAWETTRAPEIGEQLYYRATFAITVEREIGSPDPTFSVDVQLPQAEYRARSGDPRHNDELVASVTVSHAARVLVFSIVDDSVTALIPNEFVRSVDAAAAIRMELPDPMWRARGLRFRAALPAGVERQEELLAVVALRTATTDPPNRMSLLDFQRWLVRIPAGGQAVGFAAYGVRR